MKNNLLIILSNFIVITLFTLKSKAHNKMIFCYYSSNAVNRRDLGKFLTSNIDTNLCTHIGYSYLSVNKNGAVINSDRSINNLNGLIQLQALKTINEYLKTILVIKIQKSETKLFSNVIQNVGKVQQFITTAIEIMDVYKLDGLNIEWDYNDAIGHLTIFDKMNFLKFIQMVTVVRDWNNYTLSITVDAQESKAKILYNIRDMHKYLDYINLKTYDFYGIWNWETAFHSPLEGTKDPKLNVIAAVQYWLDNGVPPNKLIFGISFYGRTFKLKNYLRNDVGDEILGPGISGFYTEQTGIIGYYEICLLLKYKQLWQEFNVKMKSTYAYDNYTWISYDNKQSIHEKINYVKKINLNGIMIWSIDVDDFNGNCDVNGQKFPLLNFINDDLNNEIIMEPSKTTVYREFSLCPKRGKFVIEKQCDRYLFCAKAGDYKPIVEICPNGLLYHETAHECMLARFVQCDRKRD